MLDLDGHLHTYFCYNFHISGACRFWKFVADVPGDMSAGTLYGAKLTQINDVYGGEFNVSWIKLGHGTQAEVEKMVLDDKITFSQIFDVMPFTAGIGCVEGYTSISKRDNALGAQCLKLKVCLWFTSSKLLVSKVHSDLLCILTYM